MNNDSNKTIIRHASRFFSGTLLSRLLGLVRDICMAAYFGTGAAVAAFFVAFRFAHVLRRLFGEGALQSAFVPLFEGLRHESENRAKSFFTSVSILLGVGLTCVVILTMGLLWLTNGLSNEVVRLVFLMLPSLVFICLFGLNAALLQCEKHFFTTGMAPALFNIVWIAGIFWYGSLETSDAMRGMACVVVFACLAQWLITLPKSYYMYSWSRPFSSDLRRLGKPLLLGIGGVAATQINNALDGLFALYAEVGGAAYLWYAIRLQQLPLALFGLAMSGALLPPLSRAIKAGDENRYRAFIGQAVRQTCYVMIPMSVALFLIGDSAVALIFARGDFDGLSVMHTTYCLWGYAAGLLPMSLIQILAPAFYAKGNYRTPMLATAWSVVANICLNTFFVFVMQWGAASIALATCISAWINLWLLSGRLKALAPWQVCKAVATPSLIVGLGTFLVVGFDRWILNMPVFHTSLEKINSFIALPFWKKITTLGVESLLISFFWGVVWLIKSSRKKRS